MANRVLTIRLDRMVTLSLCLSELLLVLQIVFSRREVRVWGATELGKELKRILNKYEHICSGFFLTPSLSLSPTSLFSFFLLLIIEENVCNTLQQCRPLFFGGPPRLDIYMSTQPGVYVCEYKSGGSPLTKERKTSPGQSRCSPPIFFDNGIRSKEFQIC